MVASGSKQYGSWSGEYLGELKSAEYGLEGYMESSPGSDVRGVSTGLGVIGNT